MSDIIGQVADDDESEGAQSGATLMDLDVCVCIRNAPASAPARAHHIQLGSCPFLTLIPPFKTQKRGKYKKERKRKKKGAAFYRSLSSALARDSTGLKNRRISWPAPLAFLLLLVAQQMCCCCCYWQERASQCCYYNNAPLAPSLVIRRA